MQDVCKYTSRPREPRHRCNELQELKTESDEVQTCEWPCQVKQGLAGCDDSQLQDTSIQLARGEWRQVHLKKVCSKWRLLKQMVTQTAGNMELQRKTCDRQSICEHTVVNGKL